MVLQSNFARRLNAENTPPTIHPNAPAKSLASRLRTSLHDAARRRRGRTNGGTHAPKYAVEHAKRRSLTKSPSVSIRFNITSISSTPPPVADVEMKDAEPLPSVPVSKTIPVVLPKQLGRPEYSEVSKEAVEAVDPELADIDPEYVREKLEELGPSMLQVLSTVKANPTKDSLPKELSIIVQDLASVTPSHMIAVYGPPSRSAPSQRRRVTLFPVHSIVFALHCAKLPPFPPISVPTTPAPGSREMVVPVWPLCLPSPQTFPQLSSYLYNKRNDLLLSSLLPCPPPATLEQESSLLLPFASKLAGTYTAQALLQQTMTVHGFWQNVCALGIFDDELWDIIDLVWQILLTAVAIATGNPQAMIPIPSPSQPPALSQPQSQASSSTSELS